MNASGSSSNLDAEKPGPDFSVAAHWQGRTAVLTVTGDVDMVTAPKFQESLSTALRDLPDTLVVDLDAVHFFASAGLSALVGAYSAADGSTQLRVVASQSATLRPLQVTALDRKIPVYASRADALADD